MYRPPPGIKRDPVRRWKQTDRVFFGHGACHILAGVCLSLPINRRFSAIWVKPCDGLPGSHVYVTDGRMAFDYHGFSQPEKLYAHHAKGWRAVYPEWRAELEPVTFGLLNTADLNERKMRGPDQYHGNVVSRAEQFIQRFDKRRLELESFEAGVVEHFNPISALKHPCEH